MVISIDLSSLDVDRISDTHDAVSAPSSTAWSTSADLFPASRTPARWLLLGLLPTLAGCAVSQRQEVELGASSAQQVSAQLPLVRDAAATHYLTQLGTRLSKATDTRGLTWTFTIVDSKEVNAFALPGGWIYVNRGLIERTSTESELAGVIAHEIGHVTRRHSVQQLQQASGANVGLTLLCTLTTSCQSGVSRAAINLGGSALFARFSRDDESEADAEAVVTTIDAGISPRGIPAMFRTLLRERTANPGAVDAFFASHPLEERRITATEAKIATYPAASIDRLLTDTKAFQTFRKRLRTLPPSPTPRPTPPADGSARPSALANAGRGS